MKKSKQALLSYGLSSNVPAITVPDVELFRSERGAAARNYFQNKVDLLNQEYTELMELAEQNDIVYKAEYKFEPKVGGIYHLYKIKDRYTLSLISPNEWDYEHIGSYEFTADAVWKPAK